MAKSGLSLSVFKHRGWTFWKEVLVGPIVMTSHRNVQTTCSKAPYAVRLTPSV